MNRRVGQQKQINAKYVSIWKNIIQNKVEKINVHSAEAIQKEIDSHEKDVERIQKLIENGNSND